mmetsp:Transcript_12572/g.35853  ORF Transcript_12572/g.35853 Transcript_12572/m.35853 type:complete len:300 (-) Transcript_12572:43-942(-)
MVRSQQDACDFVIAQMRVNVHHGLRDRSNLQMEGLWIHDRVMVRKLDKVLCGIGADEHVNRLPRPLSARRRRRRLRVIDEERLRLLIVGPPGEQLLHGAAPYPLAGKLELVVLQQVAVIPDRLPPVVSFPRRIRQALQIDRKGRGAVKDHVPSVDIDLDLSIVRQVGYVRHRLVLDRQDVLPGTDQPILDQQLQGDAPRPTTPALPLLRLGKVGEMVGAHVPGLEHGRPLRVVGVCVVHVRLGRRLLTQAAVTTLLRRTQARGVWAFVQSSVRRSELPRPRDVGGSARGTLESIHMQCL